MTDHRQARLPRRLLSLSTLIDATLSGDSMAFGELVTRYQNRLYNTMVHLVGCAESRWSGSRQFQMGNPGSQRPRPASVTTWQIIPLLRMYVKPSRRRPSVPSKLPS
jgi:hypothetical protein